MMSSRIHPSAIIAEGAFIDSSVTIGPYCVVGPSVTLLEGARLISHVSVDGYTTIGKQTTLYPFASIGHPPQDLKYGNEPSKLIIGDHTTIREYVTIQPGTKGDRMETTVGNHVFLMVSSHVAHDCVIEDHVIMANNATLGGHVHIGHHAIVGGLCAIQQFVHIGAHAMIGGMSGVDKDVVPFGLVMGDRAHLRGINLVGLKRGGFSSETIENLLTSYKIIFENPSGSIDDRLQQLTPFKDDPSVATLIDFIARDNRRPLCMTKDV